MLVNPDDGGGTASWANYSSRRHPRFAFGGEGRSSGRAVGVPAGYKNVVISEPTDAGIVSRCRGSFTR